MTGTFHEESINTGSQAFDIVVGQYGDAKGTKDQFEKTDPSCLHGPIAALGDTTSFAEHIASRLEDVRTRLSDAWQGDTSKEALDIVAAMHTDATQISTSAAQCASALSQFQQQWTSARSQALNLYEGVLGTGLNEDNGQAHTIFREFCQAMSDRMHDMPGTLTYHDGLNPYEQYGGGGTGPGGSGYGGSGGSFGGGGGGVPGGHYGGTGTVGSLDPGYPHQPGGTVTGGGPGTMTPAPGGPGGYPGFPGPGGGPGSGAPGGSWPGGAGGAGIGGTTTLSGYSGPGGGTSGFGASGGGGGFGIPGGGAGGIGAGGALAGGGAGVTGNAAGGIVPMATVGPAGAAGGGAGGTRAGVMPMHGGRGDDDSDRDRSTWLDEDDDVWGAAEGLPPVLS